MGKPRKVNKDVSPSGPPTEMDQDAADFMSSVHRLFVEDVTKAAKELSNFQFQNTEAIKWWEAYDQSVTDWSNGPTARKEEEPWYNPAIGSALQNLRKNEQGQPQQLTIDQALELTLWFVVLRLMIDWDPQRTGYTTYKGFYNCTPRSDEELLQAHMPFLPRSSCNALLPLATSMPKAFRFIDWAIVAPAPEDHPEEGGCTRRAFGHFDRNKDQVFLTFSDDVYKETSSDSVGFDTQIGMRSVAYFRLLHGDIVLVAGCPIKDHFLILQRFFSELARQIYSSCEKSRCCEFLVPHIKQCVTQQKLLEVAKADIKATGLDAIVGKSRAIQKVKEDINRFEKATAPKTVLILGETGVGKELVARAIHAVSRPKKPFVCVNCATLSEDLLASELFGHEKGAFTDARERRIGKFEYANGGTLMLDEIGEMSVSIQPKFLRVLEGHPFERLGGTKPVEVDVLVIAVTNRDLETEVAEGRFREDLYHRLAVVTIDVPPLRDRREDIPELAYHFLNQAVKRGDIKRFTPEAMKELVKHTWPGNARELKNAVIRAVYYCDGPSIEVEHLMLRKPTSTGDIKTRPPTGTPALVGSSFTTSETKQLENGKPEDVARILFEHAFEKGTNLSRMDGRIIEDIVVKAADKVKPYIKKAPKPNWAASVMGYVAGLLVKEGVAEDGAKQIVVNMCHAVKWELQNWNRVAQRTYEKARGPNSSSSAGAS